MRLKATFTIDLEAADFISAAERQRDMERLLQDIRAQYASAELKITERRLHHGRRHSLAEPRTDITGCLNTYG